MIFSPAVLAESNKLREQLETTLRAIHSELPGVDIYDPWGSYDRRKPAGILAREVSDLLNKLKAMGY